MAEQTDLESIRSDFIEKSGLISQAEGLPRIAGRVFGMLIFDGDKVSFGDLAERLQVSRASISTSNRLLEERGLVKRTTKPGHRGDFFQLAPNPYGTMLEGVHKRMQATLDDITQTIAALPGDAEAIGRLSEYAHFYESLVSAFTVARDELKAKAADNTGRLPASPKE